MLTRHILILCLLKMPDVIPYQNTQSLVRICANQDEQLVAVVCLGAYITSHWVVAKYSCIHDEISVKASEIYMMGGSDFMDCRTGQRREFNVDFDTVVLNSTELVLIRLPEPFGNVSTIKIAKRRNFTDCETFCSWKMLKLTGDAQKPWLKDATISELKSVCGDRRFTKYNADIKVCDSDKRKSNDRVKYCLRNPESHKISQIKNLLWFPAVLTSPLVCKGQLVGFFDEGDSDNFPSFVFIRYYMDKIRKSMKEGTYRRKHKQQQKRKKPKKLKDKRKTTKIP